MAQEVADKVQEIMKEAAKPFLHTLELDSDVSRFSECIEDCLFDGIFIAKKGDIVCINEHSFHNVTTDTRFNITIKDKSCFNSDGPLPTYWIH